MLITYLDEEKIWRSQDMISMYDQQLVITGWNAACESHTGIPHEKALNQSLMKVFSQYDLKKDYRVNCLLEAANEGKSFYFPGLPYQYRKGKYYQVIVPLKKSNNELIGVLNIVRDASLVSGTVSKKDLLIPIIKTDPSHISHLLK